MLSCVASVRLRDIFERLDLPDPYICVLAAACHVSDVLSDWLSECEVSQGINMAEERELVLKDLTAF